MRLAPQYESSAAERKKTVNAARWRHCVTAALRIMNLPRGNNFNARAQASRHIGTTNAVGEAQAGNDAARAWAAAHKGAGGRLARSLLRNASHHARTPSR
jgi:hypothetical protein